MAYATAPEADVIALEIGNADFLSVDDTGFILTADGAIASGATALDFDSLSQASAVAQFQLLKNNNELTRVENVVYNLDNVSGTLTLLRGAYGTTAASIADDQVLSIRNLTKISLLETATQDIVNYHKQTLSGGELWYSGSDNLKRACALQAMYLMRVGDARYTADFIRNVSSGSYSDTVISISGAATRMLDGAAKDLVDFVLQMAGIGVGEYGRA